MAGYSVLAVSSHYLRDLIEEEVLVKQMSSR